MNYGMHICHIFEILIIMFDVAIIWKGQSHQNGTFSLTVDLFLADATTHGYRNHTYVIQMHKVI